MSNDNIYWLQSENTKLGQWQRKINKVTGSYTFCILPWIHLATRPNGDMRLCCNANSSGAGIDHAIGIVKDNIGYTANFDTTSPSEVWNNNYMKNTRTTMLNNNIPDSCIKCFKEESLGIVSKRMWETGYWYNEGIDIDELVKQTTADGSIPEKLLYLDLRLGNICNLKCIMCSPHDSSKWITDHEKVYPNFESKSIKDQTYWDKTTHNNKWHENKKFWSDLYHQIPNIKQLYFAGGEPLMIREHKLFLEEIIKRGYADKILIRYNTNGLLLDQDIIDLWTKFKKVKVGISIDAINAKNYYIRYPSEWDIIVKNLHILDNTPSNIEVSIATAIQILNIKHLPEFAKWKIQQKFKKINLEHISAGIQAGGGIINMHLLYIPTFLSIKCLTQKDKIEVTQIFTDFKEWLYNNYRKDDDFWLHNPYGWKRWQSVLDFMNSEDMSYELPAFTEYINALDKIRNIKCSDIFPELSHLL